MEEETCQRCNSSRIAEITGKCADNFNVVLVNRPDTEYSGYVPDDMNIGSGKYIEFSYCLECGQIQDNFPLEETEIEQ